MSKIGEPERRAQKRILRLLPDPVTGLGWTYLGDRHTRAGNANIEEDELRSWLLKRHDAGVVAKAIAELKRAARIDGVKLYEANQAAYEMLRYGVPVVPGPGETPVTVMFVDWEQPSANDLGVAEEVAIAGQDPTTYDKRPDLVLYEPARKEVERYQAFVILRLCREDGGTRCLGMIPLVWSIDGTPCAIQVT